MSRNDETAQTTPRTRRLTLCAGHRHNITIEVNDAATEIEDSNEAAAARQALLEGPIRERVEAEARVLSRSLVVHLAPMTLEDGNDKLCHSLDKTPMIGATRTPRRSCNR